MKISDFPLAANLTGGEWLAAAVPSPSGNVKITPLQILDLFNNGVPLLFGAASGTSLGIGTAAPASGLAIAGGATITNTGASLVQRGAASGYPQNLFATNTTSPAPGNLLIGTEIDLTNPGGYAAVGTTYAAAVFECVQSGTITFASGKTEGFQGSFSIGAALHSQGGTVGGVNASGQVWGGADIGALYTGATGFVSVVGREVDVMMQAGTSANVRCGLNIVDYLSAVQGTVVDCAMAIGAATGVPGFKIGIDFGSAMNSNTTPGMAPVGSLIGATLAYSVANVINLPFLTITGNIIKTQNVTWAGSGALTTGGLTVDNIGNLVALNLTLNGTFLNGPSGLVLQTANADRLTLSAAGSVVVGAGALATTATDGFFYIAGGAGPPTGVPTGNAGRYPFYWDDTNKKLWIYDGAWLQPRNPAAGAIITWQ